MNSDMDSLQNAEKALENLQRELEEAKQAQESVITEKQNLEKKLQDSKTDLDRLPNTYSDLEISQLKAEIEVIDFRFLYFFFIRSIQLDVADRIANCRGRAQGQVLVTPTRFAAVAPAHARIGK